LSAASIDCGLLLMALTHPPVRHVPRAPSRSRASFQKTLESAKHTMVLSEIVLLALDSFRASKIRFALTALGMVIGSASLILVVTIGLTGKQYVLKTIQGVGTNMVELEYAGGGVGAVSDTRNDFLTGDDVTAVMQQVPVIAAASPMLEIHDRVAYPGGKLKDVLVLGVSPEYRQVRNLIVIAGRFFDEKDEETHAKSAVITEPFARARFGSPDAAINQSLELSGIPFTIIGTFKESIDTMGSTEIDSETVLIPYSVGRYFTGTDYVKQIFFSVRDQNDVEEAAKQIVAVVSSRHNKNSVYKTETLTGVLEVANQVTNALTIVLLLVSTVTLAVGGVGIMNIMLATVRSRIREIGIRKAVGATAREIKLQFLVEAVFISLSGGIVGAALGVAIPLAVSIFTGYVIPITGWSVVISLVTSTLVGVIFGTLPANRAAQMNPVDSLKYE
jgi:putative ABC transport system permease protein